MNGIVADVGANTLGWLSIKLLRVVAGCLMSLVQAAPCAELPRFKNTVTQNQFTRIRASTNIGLFNPTYEN